VLKIRTHKAFVALPSKHATFGVKKWLRPYTRHIMETQQLLEILARMEAKMNANQAEIKADRKAHQARMDAKHKEMMAMLDAYHERKITRLGKTEADTEKTEPDPGMMQFTEEHQETPRMDRSDAGRRTEEAA
jgi:hypothetical protein